MNNLLGADNKQSVQITTDLPAIICRL